MHHPTDRITHTTAFVIPVVEHWLEREIAQWVHPMKDRSDDPSHHDRTLLPRSYISLPQDNTYHGLCHPSRGALAGNAEMITRNSPLAPGSRISLQTAASCRYARSLAVLPGGDPAGSECSRPFRRPRPRGGGPGPERSPGAGGGPGPGTGSRLVSRTCTS